MFQYQNEGVKIFENCKKWNRTQMKILARNDKSPT